MFFCLRKVTITVNHRGEVFFVCIANFVGFVCFCYQLRDFGSVFLTYFNNVVVFGGVNYDM